MFEVPSKQVVFVLRSEGKAARSTASWAALPRCGGRSLHAAPGLETGDARHGRKFYAVADAVQRKLPAAECQLRRLLPDHRGCAEEHPARHCPTPTWTLVLTTPPLRFRLLARLRVRLGLILTSQLS